MTTRRRLLPAAEGVLLTEDEAAQMLRLSCRTLRDLRRKGMIRYVRPSPRKIGYTPDDIAEYIDKCQRQDEPPCPSINPRKAVSGTTTSSKTGTDIMARLNARPSGMPKGLRMIEGGKSS